MKKFIFLYFIIFLEGYVVLSAELLAIRQLTPFVGSGTDTVSIIIAAVLMPLAIGYYAGGRFKEQPRATRKNKTIRSKLLSNILIATLFLAPALSYTVLYYFFETLSAIGIHGRLTSTTIYAVIFLIYPVFLLAQTIPLVSNFFSSSQISLITGKMLFFSTVGSFMGAVFSTLVLMATIGVHHTATLTILCLCALYIILSKKLRSKPAIIILLATGIPFTLFLNSDHIINRFKIVENNQYNTIRVLEEPNGARILSLNNNRSSSYNPRTRKGKKFFAYIEYIRQNFIAPIQYQGPTRSILVIGAGGFTVGLDDYKNEYVFVDIDGSLKDVTEKHFLKKKLAKNKKFEPIPARAYLRKAQQEGKKFDLVILDAYQGNSTIPEQLLTKEFYQDVKNITKEDGIILGNFVASIGFSNAFSMNIDNTLKQVFPHISRHIIQDRYNGWSDKTGNYSNIMYIYHHRKNVEHGIYTDNKNRVYHDKERSVR